ncbi:P-loop NTPase family protein [Bifidobacterium vespertilionis]|uniref:Helicase superfamily 3 single-stranded DNA/RNA virus domain-containing protein n=1 Tax=Bifidobacterium vespertilionis TaxID=2562524 RepID=A0A5J5DVI4_9BIFI|nr:hypothetical protein [Bifidobacterium vespertilionis]KAA8820189.1 hypothetical protein EMO90_07100 [Bifidobacterium vespertilionis]KAA8823886.1 hypothetical protein EM848_03550 [Bifidobacterium vespertilionis]
MKKYIRQDDGSIVVKRVEGRGRGNSAFPVPWDNPEDDFDDAESLGWRWLYAEGCRSVCDKAMFRPSASQAAIAMQKDLDGKENPRYLGSQCQSFFLTVPVWSLGGEDLTYPVGDERRYMKAVSRLKAILDRGKNWEWEFQIELGSNSSTTGKAPYAHAQMVVYTPRIDGSKFLKFFPYDIYCRRTTKKEAADLYCRKEDTRVAGPYMSDGFVMGGKQGQREDLVARDEAREKAFEGTDPDELIAQDLSLTTYARDLDRAYAAGMKHRAWNSGMRDVDILCFVGKPGAGKSLYARCLAKRRGRSYFEAQGANPFDDYSGQETVVWDEFGRGWVPPLGDITRWYNGAPGTKLSARYHDKYALFTLLIVTSNAAMPSWYSEEDLAHDGDGALARRVSTVEVTLDDDFDTVRFTQVSGPVWPDLPQSESILSMMQELGYSEKRLAGQVAKRDGQVADLQAKQAKAQADGDWDEV